MKAIKQDYDYDEVFQKIQTEYLETKQQKHLTEMYKLLLQYYFAKLCKYAQTRNLHFSEEKQEELIHDMASRTIEHYLKRPDFKIEKLGGYATFDFRKILFNQKEQLWEQNILSLDELIEANDGNDFSTGANLLW